MTSALLIKLTLFAAIISIAYSVGIYEQCAGEGYGTLPCHHGLTCFQRNKWYSSCQPSCPKHVGWECEFTVPVAPVSAIAIGWDQCGGDGWRGSSVCEAGYGCYARSVFYSQCRPIGDCPAGWTCPPVGVTTVAPVVVATTAVPTGPVILAAYSQCNHIGNAVCPAGTACFRNNANYSECRHYCPPTWVCETDVAGANEQCGGEDYVGVTHCAEGLRCYARSKWFAHCAASCPGADWVC